MVKATETKARKRKLFIYECIFGLLLAISGLVYSINHTLAISSILLLLGGSIVSAFALRLKLLNNGAKHSKATTWWFIVAISAVLLCGYLFCVVINPESKPHPHFTVAFSTADAPTKRVSLTNDFFITTNLSNFEICGDLVVPKRLDQLSVKFKFGIENDSPVVAEYIEVSILFSKELLILPDDGWSAGVPIGKGTNEMQSWICNPAALLPGNGVILADLRISPAPWCPPDKFFPVAIRVRSKDSPGIWLEFGVLFWPPTTNFPTIARPFVVFEPKLPNGLRRFSMSPKKLKEFQK